MRWKPKYKVGDEVCVAVPELVLLSTHHKFGFGAKGIVTFVGKMGFYRIKFTKILFDEYFSHKPLVGDILGFHFNLVEGVDKKLGVVLKGAKIKVIFT